MLNGIDISSWQTGIDLSVVPCDFVVIKATGGIGYVNPDCDRAYQQAKAQGKKLGFYHYAREKGYKGSACLLYTSFSCGVALTARCFPAGLRTFSAKSNTTSAKTRPNCLR